MAGQKIARMREAVTDAVSAYEKAKGTEDEAFALGRLNALKAELAKEEEFRARFGKKPGAPSVWKKEPGPKSKAIQARKERVRKAVRLVGKDAVGDMRLDGLETQAGTLAAEIAVGGVPRDFAAVKPGEPEPLTPSEFVNAQGVVAAVSAREGDSPLLTDGSVRVDRWLAEAFPSLPPGRRIKCARFLAGMATLAADKPGDNAPDGSTVIENALRTAGMTYVELEQSRMGDVRFSDAVAAIKAARKRCIMDRLEETLQNRALFGQIEETVDRFGVHNEVRRIDNRLAFDMLKHGHDSYLKQNIEDKAKATAMTLMIAQGSYPEAPKMKEAEVIDVK